MQPKAAIVRYARQKLRYAAGADMSRVTHGYFVSHSPRIWRPLAIDMNHVTDPEDGLRLPVAYVSGSVHSIRPRYRPGGASGDHSGENHQVATHFVPEGADMNDALFEQSHHANDETDIHEDEAKRYVAGQRAVRQFVGLDPEKAPYHAAILTSKELADEAARATGGFVHEVQLNPRQFEGNHIPVLNARDGAAVLIKSPGLAGPLNNSETQEDISRQVHLAKFSGTRDEALRHLHQLNQRYWPLLTQHADALQTIPGSVHPHTALLGSHLRDHQHLLAPSHEELLQAGEPISTIYQMALRHPEEPVHRMALADTLDDHGHSGAADFFRSTLPGSENTAQPQKLSRRGNPVQPSTDQQPEILTPEIGFNVNDKSQAFTDQILSGDKTIETRNKPTLHPYIGQRMGLVRTGKGKAQLVGYVTIGKPKLYTSQRAFDAEAGSHLVGSDSPFHISKTKNGSKWGYELLDVERIEPRHLVDGSGIAPNPRVARKLQRSSSSSSPSLRSFVVGYAAQKLKYAAAQPRFQVGSEVLVRGNDDIMRRAVYRGPNQHHESNHYVDIIAQDGSLIRNVQTPHDRIQPSQNQPDAQKASQSDTAASPETGKSERLNFRDHLNRLQPGQVYRRYGSNGELQGTYRFVGHNNTASHYATRLDEQNSPPQYLIGHYDMATGQPRQFELGNEDQLARPKQSIKNLITNTYDENAFSSDSKLERILANGHGSRASDVANQVRQHFANMFGKPVSDETIMKALRVPMAHAGADPNSPHFDPRYIDLHIGLANPEAVSASVESTVPGYKFSANTTLRKHSIFNSYQRHGGDPQSSVKTISTPHILLNQADAAHELGIGSLKVGAAMDHRWAPGDFNGGVIWPRYGYNAALKNVVTPEAHDRILNHLVSAGIHRTRNESTIHDLMQTPGGYGVLSHYTPAPGVNNGRVYHNAPHGTMYFDTDPSSVSRRILADQIAKIEKGGSSGSQQAA